MCDKIILLENGKVCEEGTHEEIMKMRDGKYREMFVTQGKYYKQGSDNQ